MGYKVDNAIIMAAGLSNRFAPISYEKPKALIEVRGEILIERQICQLMEKGIKDIILITGYKKELFDYLKEKYPITIVENKEYRTRNNHSSIYAAKEYLKNTYICSADNYFTINPFEQEVDESYYAALFAPDKTDEWCLQINENDYITGIEIGGNHQWYMLGHVFWSEEFTNKFIHILEKIYDYEETKNKLWEDIYREHLQQFKMKIRRYKTDQIYEFDSLDELRVFDNKYLNHSGSAIMEKLSEKLNCAESELTNIKPVKNNYGELSGIMFNYKKQYYHYYYKNELLVPMLGGEVS